MENLVLSAYLADNDDVFPRILDLYVPKGATVADVTYGKGVFWRKVPPGDYTLLPSDLSTGIDFRNLPYGAGELDCLVLDPPYMHTPGGSAYKGTTTFDACYKNSTVQTGLTRKYHDAILELYEQAGAEAHRVLKPAGILVVKCQDEVCNHKQRLTHVELVNHFTANGYIAEDLFVVVRRSRPHVSRMKQQQHARKNHSYFLVFRKKKERS